METEKFSPVKKVNMNKISSKMLLIHINTDSLDKEV